MEEKDYRKALEVIYNNLNPGFPQNLKPMSANMCCDLAEYVLKILSGKTPQQVFEEMGDREYEENGERI